ncbi:hypothetical protein [Alicycliphilus denitrificans]|uniref:hypothetical protein n=1 Tax=Alicycliphilus denitrificans TaxID=179636 RepID=UPI00217E6C8D|nr:hypothetical protein [Alicycliphilus denitrificans]
MTTGCPRRSAGATLPASSATPRQVGRSAAPGAAVACSSARPVSHAATNMARPDASGRRQGLRRSHRTAT